MSRRTQAVCQCRARPFCLLDARFSPPALYPGCVRLLRAPDTDAQDVRGVDSGSHAALFQLPASVAPGAAGKSSQNSEPCIQMLEKPIEPCISSASRLLMAKPMPVPGIEPRSCPAR